MPALRRQKRQLIASAIGNSAFAAALWIANGEWSGSPEPFYVARRQRPALEFAGEHLAKRTKKILKKLEDIEALDAQRRHKLRISVKKLRYACEFFAGLFDGRKQATQRKYFAKTLKNCRRCAKWAENGRGGG